MNCSFFLRLLLVIIVTPTAYGSDFGTKSFSGVFPLLSQISDQNHPVDSQLQADITRVSTISTSLVSLFNDQEKPLPPEYALAIDSYKDNLQQALNADSTEEASKLLQQVIQDAEIKKNYITNTSGFSAFKRSALVKVTVLTFRGGNGEPGYTVTCNPFRDSLQKNNARFPFSSDTNNASRLIPPGRYRLQLYKGSKMILSRDILVGLSQEQVEEVKIDVSNY